MTLFQSIFRTLSAIGRFWQNPHHLKLFQFNLFLISLQLLYLIFRFSELPPQVPLYFSLPWGDGRLAPASSLFLLPTFSILITIINHLVAIFLVSQHLLFSYLLIIFSLVFSVFSSVSLFHIIGLAV